MRPKPACASAFVGSLLTTLSNSVLAWAICSSRRYAFAKESLADKFSELNWRASKFCGSSRSAVLDSFLASAPLPARA